MESPFDQIKSLIEMVEPDVERFYLNKNRSAGRRVRRSLQEIKTLAQDIRMDILKRSKK